VESRLIQLAPWNNTSDREIKIRGRHSRAFYAHADKLLRDEVELARMAALPLQDESLTDVLRHRISAAREALLATQHEVEA
jgi:hypothetical protein